MASWARRPLPPRGGRILTTHQRGPVPPPYRLEQVATHLATKGDHRSLVTFVEKWWTVGEPPVPVRLAASRSLLELRALDRAYNRLKDLVEADKPNLDALALATEIQLQRSWLGQARKLAQRGLEQDPYSAVFRALLARASEVPTDPDDSSADNELTSVAELLRVAEQYLSLGQQVRARSLLERVRRRAPENRWAADLLWAMDGDFSTVDGTLADLCDRLGPDLSMVHESHDEPENTEAARAPDLGPQHEADRGFPALFRNLAGGADAGEEPTVSEAEVTAVSTMADVQKMLDDQDYGDRTDPRGEDTQIMRVQPKSPGQAPPATPSRGRDAAPNLAELRAPGMSSASDILRDVPHAGDDEDDSVVVHLRREDTSDGPGGSAEIHGLTEELELEKVMASVRGMVEDAHWAATPGPEAALRAEERRPRKASAAASKATPTLAPRVARPGGLARSWPWWVAVMVGLLGFAALLFVLMLLLVAVGS